MAGEPFTAKRSNLEMGMGVATQSYWVCMRQQAACWDCAKVTVSIYTLLSLDSLKGASNNVFSLIPSNALQDRPFRVSEDSCR
jgi:hypothetical protein